MRAPLRLLVLSLGLIQGLVSLGHASTFPDDYVMKQKFFTIGTDFEMKDSRTDQVVGKLEQRMLNWTTTFSLMDASGNVVATAKARFFAWGATCDIYGPSGELIGTVKEKVLKSLFKMSTEYSVLDGGGNEIGTSEKLQLFATYFTLMDLQGREVATMNRPALNWFTDTWTVTVGRVGAIDERVIPFIPAFKTAADAARKARSSD